MQTITSNEHSALHRIMKWISFSQNPGTGWSWSGELHWRVIVFTAQERASAAGCHSRHPHCCSRLTPHRCGCCCVMADRPQKWNHQHWSHVIFDDECKASLNHSDSHACEFHLFLRCNNPLAFQQYNVKLGHANHSCRGWPSTHQQIVH